MKTEKILQNLRYIINKESNRYFATGEINTYEMAKDCYLHIEKQQKDIEELILRLNSFNKSEERINGTHRKQTSHDQTLLSDQHDIIMKQKATIELYETLLGIKVKFNEVDEGKLKLAI